jgi:hypothetical protein
MVAGHGERPGNDLSTILDISTDSFPLRFHAEAGDSLLVGADAQVRTEGNVNQAFRSLCWKECQRFGFE